MNFYMPEVTVVIPSLLRPSLADTIKSITEQDVSCDIQIINGDNPPFQRNEGATRARTPYILFTDDDVRLQKSCLLTLITALEDDNLDVVFPALRGGFNSTPAFVSAGAGIFCRTSVCRDIHWDVEILLGDDLDWGWSMMDAGYSWVYNDNAVIYHIGHPVAISTWARKLKGKGDALLKKKHPKRFAWLKEHNSSVLGVEG